MVKIQQEAEVCKANGGDVSKRCEEERRAREKEIDPDLVDQVRSLLSAEYEQNSDKYAPNHYEEIMDPGSALTCWRYLVHNKGDPSAAFELMKASLSWRKENAIDDLDRSELIKEFWHFTPIPLCGRTREGHQVLYVLGKQYRKPHQKLKSYIPKFCANILFGWDREHNLDLEKLHCVFDVSDTGYRNIDLDFMQWLLTVKDFMPDRFHQFSVVGIPFLIRPLIHLIISWLPETYAQKTHLGSFEKLVLEQIDEHDLPLEVAGSGREDESYKLAPQDAPWASESPVFSSSEMQKYVEECIVTMGDDSKRAQMRQLQLDHEKSLAVKN